VLHEDRREGAWIVVSRIAKALLVELRQAQLYGLKRIDCGRSQRKTTRAREVTTRGGRNACDGAARVRKAGTQKIARQVAENKTSGEERVRFRVVASVQFIASELDVVFPADQADVICKLVAPHDGEVGQEDLCSQVAKAWDVEAHLAGNV